MIVCDAGPLVAAAVRQDADFHACTGLFTGLHLAERQILVPGTVVAEAGYLLERLGGPAVKAGFLRSLADRTFTPVDLEPDDYERAADLVETYSDFPLGTTDATVVAVAERLGITEIATLDHRHFHAVRPRHADSFTLLP